MKKNRNIIRHTFQPASAKTTNLIKDTVRDDTIVQNEQVLPKYWEHVRGCVYRYLRTGGDEVWYDYFAIDTQTMSINDMFPDMFFVGDFACMSDEYNHSLTDTCGDELCQRKELNILTDSTFEVVGESTHNLILCSSSEKICIFSVKYIYSYLLQDFKFYLVSADTIERFVNEKIRYLYGNPDVERFEDRSLREIPKINEQDQ